MNYEYLATFAQQGGAIYFALVFFAACLYALWPKNKAQFDDLARLPLDNENDNQPRIVGDVK